MDIKQIAELIDELLVDVEIVLKEHPPDRIFWHLDQIRLKLLVLQEILKREEK